MKSLKIITVLSTLTLLLSGCDGLGVDTSNKSLAISDYEYEIDTWGSNSEVYEFTPKSHKGKSCVFLMLDNGSAMGLQCFDKPSK